MNSFSAAGMIVCVALGAAAAHGQYSFRGLGGPTTSSVSSTAADVSSDGQTIAGGIVVSGNFRAARWSGTNAGVTLGDLAGGTVIGSAQGGSQNGAVVVGSAGSANGTEAFRWTEAGGMVGLGDLAGQGGFSSSARGVSADGNVIAGVSSRQVSGAMRFRAFRWTAAAGMVALEDLPGGEIFALAQDVSGDGSRVVGSSVGSGGQQAVYWNGAGDITGLGDLPGGAFSSRAQGVSTEGRVIVGNASSSRGSEAFRWTAESGMMGLGALPAEGFSSQANDVSADGAVVVGIGAGAGDAASGTAFVWFAGTGMLDLREYLLANGVEAVRGWSLSEGMGVSDDGRTIVGFGVNPEGRVEGWVATVEHGGVTPPPPPPDVAETFGPATMSVTAGTLVSGGVNELQSSDDRYVTLGTLAKKPMQLTAEARATAATAGELRIAWEGSAQGSTTRQDVALFDFLAGSWVTVDSRNGSVADSAREVSVANNAARFIQSGTLAVRVRLTFTPSGGKRTTTTARVDRIAWTRVP